MCGRHTLTVFSGFGGESGWGVVGGSVEKALVTIAALLDANLARLQGEINKEQKLVAAAAVNAKLTVDANNALPSNVEK